MSCRSRAGAHATANTNPKHQDQEPDGQLAERNAIAFDRALRRCSQGTEHQAKMFDLLRSRFLSPDAVSLESEGCQRRRLESNEVRHFHGEPGRGVDHTGEKIGIVDHRALVVLPIQCIRRPT